MFRRHYWTVAVLLLGMAGCNREWDSRMAEGGAEAGPVASFGAMAATAPDMRTGTRQPSAKRVGALPDRGALVDYGSSTPLQRGPFNWHRVEVSEAHALNAIASGRLVIDIPDGRRLSYAYEKHIEHPTGDWTWVGRLEGGASGKSAIITFGDTAVFGVLDQDVHQPALRLGMAGGHAWLVEADPRRIARDGGFEKRTVRPDYFIPPKLATGVRDAAGDEPRAASVGAVAATTNATTTVDVAIGYTSGYASALGGASAAVTRINNLVVITNEAYANSDINAQVRVVKTVQVSYPDNTDNGATLEALTGYKSGSGATTPDSAFDALRQAREDYGADLVSLVRDFRTPENDGCGIAWLIGGARSGVSQSDQDFGYSVVSDGTDLDETDGKTYFCREETLAHEFGHNEGAQHDVETAKGDDGVLDADEYGAYSYSFGYKTAAGSGNFYTVMAYGDPGQTAYRIFSNPRKTSFCGGYPCGTATADNTQTLNNTIPIVATFRATVVVDEPPVLIGQGVLLKQADFNGNRRSDIFFYNHAAERISLWFMNGLSRTGTASASYDGSHRVVDSGDFDGDGRTDLLLTSSSRDVIIASSNGSGLSFVDTGLGYTDAHKLIGVADVNGDGKSDILIRKKDMQAVTIWYMDGTTRIAFNTMSVSGVLEYVGSGDLNGDGRQDLLWEDSQNNVYASMSSGTGFTTVYAGLTHSAGYRLYGLLDVNGDGRSDIILHSQELRRLVVWYMNGTSRYAYNSHATAAGFRLAGKGDFDGNGKGDLLLENPADRSIRYMLSSGTVFALALLGYVPQAGSQIMDLD